MIKGDLGFVGNPFFYEVFLNGKKLNYCVVADEEKRLAIVLCQDNDEKPIIRRDNSGPQLKTVYGEIEIIHHKDII